MSRLANDNSVGEEDLSIHNRLIESIQHFVHQRDQGQEIERQLEQNWRLFYERNHSVIERLAAESWVSPDDAEDLVQQVWLEVVRRIRRLKPGGNCNSFANWLAKVMRSQIVNELRRRGNVGNVAAGGSFKLAEQLVDVQLSAEETATRREIVIHVRRGLEQLRQEASELTYHVIHLRHMEGASVSEVARSLQLSAQQVWDRNRAGVRKLRRILRELKPDGPIRRSPK